jgi:sugar phosphate isomerase/epimerase
MQSLFNGIDVNLFENQQRFIDHFFRVIDIALLLGAKRLVYGSPLTRKIENISQEGKFIEIFNIIADRIKNTDMVICIEPNSKKYGCNYLHDLSSSSDIIRKINRPNIRLNFDSGNAIMENDDESTIYKNMDIISHAHVSNPFLKEINRSANPRFRQVGRVSARQRVVSKSLRKTKTMPRISTAILWTGRGMS